MILSEAIKTLDEVIPSPHNKMVDGEHMKIAIAWLVTKTNLSAYSNTLEVIAEMFEKPCNYNDIDEYMLANAGDWCEKNCGQVSAAMCWRKYMELGEAKS